jgi:hypothetical protein
MTATISCRAECGIDDAAGSPGLECVYGEGFRLASRVLDLGSTARRCVLSREGITSVTDSARTPSPAAPFQAVEALALARELQPYLENCHLGVNSGLPGGCVPPILGIDDRESEQWRRRTFDDAMLASPESERPRSRTYVLHDGPSWTDRILDSTPEIDPQETLPPSASESFDVEMPLPADRDAEPAGPLPFGRMYRNPDDYRKRTITLWLLRHFHERLQSRNGDPNWLDLAEAFRRLLESPAWQVREPDDRDRVVGDRWIAVGRRVATHLPADLVDAAKLLVQSEVRGHTAKTPASGCDSDEQPRRSQDSTAVTAGDDRDLKERLAIAALLVIGPNATKIAGKVGVKRTTLLGWRVFRDLYDKAKQDAEVAKRSRRRGRRNGRRDFEIED